MKILNGSFITPVVRVFAKRNFRVPSPNCSFYIDISSRLTATILSSKVRSCEEALLISPLTGPG